MPNIVLGVPPAVLELVQQGLIEREFHDSLFPNLAYRAEFMAEKWEGQAGQEVVMTRAGLLAPTVKPIEPGQDPTPKKAPYEQWIMRLDQYTDTTDTHMPTSTVAASSLFIRDIQTLGLQAGMSINRVARNVMFKAYLSGQTNALLAYSTGATQIRVASLNGFTDVVIPGSNVRPQNVSPTFPLPVTIGTGSTAEVKNVVGWTADSSTDLFGPGTLTLSAGLTNNQPIRAAIVSAYAPRVVRAAGGTSVDAINSNDTLSLQQIINAVAYLRNNTVQPHEDGTFHAHISPLAQAQVYTDPVFQRLNQSIPDGMAYKEGFLGQLAGVSFFMNVESPNLINAGSLVATAAASGSTVAGAYAPDIGAEAQNGNGVAIGRVLLTGKGAGYERYLDESDFVTEAGTTGKIGEFDVVNNGVQVLTENIRLIIRAPLDRLQQKVSSTWSITTGYACPTDLNAPSGPERYKRALVMEHAL